MAIINGTAASDDLAGTAAADTINGLAGDDRLQGYGGNDKLYGGTGDDNLLGGDGADVLKGGSGYDFLVGGQGNDTLDGGTTLDAGSLPGWSDFDTASYYNEGGSLGVSVNLALNTATDTYGNTDRLLDIERVVGSSAADTLIGGNVYNDRFESFTGYQGADSIDGGSGWDAVDYYLDRSEGGNNGIVADLLAGTIRDGFGSIDKVSNIEEVRGSSYSDDLKGSNGDDEFKPFGGNDAIDGRLGNDTVSYSIDVWRDGTVGIQANLTTGVIFDTGGYIDTVVSIENVRGSFWDDTILGDGGANRLSGAEGDDVIKGRNGDDLLYGDDGSDLISAGAGNDWIEGGGGNDTLRGGTGRDTFGIYGNSDTDIIVDFKTGIDKLDVSSAGFASAAAVLSHLRIVTASEAILDLGDDTYVQFDNVDTATTFLAAGDIIF